MATQAKTAPVATPGDSPTPAKQKHPARGTRKRVLGEGEGDYCVMEIAPAGRDIPTGTLLPIPEVPRFEHSLAAMQWIRQKSGDKLAGKQVAVIAFKEILDITVVTKPTVQISTKAKTVIPRAEK